MFDKIESRLSKKMQEWAMDAVPGTVAAPERCLPAPVGMAETCWNVKGNVYVQDSLSCNPDETVLILVLFLQFIMPLAYFNCER